MAAPPDNRFAQRVQWLLRQGYGGKQDALAAALTVDKSTVSRWIRNEVRRPHPAQRAAVQRLLAEHGYDRQLAAAIRQTLADLETHDDDDGT